MSSLAAAIVYAVVQHHAVVPCSLGAARGLSSSPKFGMCMLLRGRGYCVNEVSNYL